jgi:NADPH:quinone reductase-like Zn-dependent oxidoreductase
MDTTQIDNLRSPPDRASGPMMTAVVQDHYSPVPEDLFRVAQIAAPIVGDGEVLVRVRAAGVDRGTWHIMSGLPYPIRLAGFGVRRPKYANPGRNLAGTVEVIGSGVTGFAPGDAVFGTATSTFAQYSSAQTGKLARKPARLSFEQAASIPVSGVTALQAVRDHGRVRPGEKVLIIGASGGVGAFAVQIAKASGAEVTGVCSTGKADLVRALGADHVIDYNRADFAAGRHRYDVVLDTGGNSRLSHLRRALAPRGRLVIVGGETDGRVLGGSDRQIRAKLLSPFIRQQLGTFVAKENGADLTTLGELVEAGKLTAAIDRAYPLAEADAAIRRLLDGKAHGKLVVSVPAPAPTTGSTP